MRELAKNALLNNHQLLLGMAQRVVTDAPFVADSRTSTANHLSTPSDECKEKSRLFRAISTRTMNSASVEATIMVKYKDENLYRYWTETERT